MKKFSFLFAFLCASVMSFAIDWSGVEWLGNGVGEGYSEKYKAVVSPELPGTGFINNLQRRPDQTPVLHVCFPSAAFGAISLAEDQYDTEGAGLFFHLDVFKNQETEFTVVCQDVTYTFTVYYADGIASGLIAPVVKSDVRKVVKNGMLYIEKNGVLYNAIGSKL